MINENGRIGSNMPAWFHLTQGTDFEAGWTV
jgi:hypothetical protein